MANRRGAPARPAAQTVRPKNAARATALSTTIAAGPAARSVRYATRSNSQPGPKVPSRPAARAPNRSPLRAGTDARKKAVSRSAVSETTSRVRATLGQARRAGDTTGAAAGAGEVSIDGPGREARGATDLCHLNPGRGANKVAARPAARRRV